jgi:hypothetical protein
VALIAHLRARAREAGDAQQLARLADRLRERLLHIDVFAEHQRHVGGQEVHVVRRRHADRIDLVVHLEEHLPKILVAFRLRELLEELLHVRALPIDVADRDDLFVLLRHAIAEAFTAAADLGEAHFGARSDDTCLARVSRQRGATGESQHGRSHGRELNEVATSEGVVVRHRGN